MPSSPEDVKRYTLSEAAMEIKRRECAMNGHSYDVLQQVGQAGPTAVICTRCGKSWGIER